LGKEAQEWRNVAEHCLVAGALAELIARELRLSSKQTETVTHAAILHDWYKKEETLARKQAGDDIAAIRKAVAEKKDEDKRQLRDFGFPDDVIRLTGANTPENASGPQSIEEKIIWYVDAMLSDTEPVRICKRFDDLERHPKRGELNKLYSRSFEHHLGKPMYDLQRELGQTIGRQLALALGYKGQTDDLPQYLLRLLKDKIAQGWTLS